MGLVITLVGTVNLLPQSATVVEAGVVVVGCRNDIDNHLNKMEFFFLSCVISTVVVVSVVEGVVVSSVVVSVVVG